MNHRLNQMTMEQSILLIQMRAYRFTSLEYFDA